MVNDVHGVDANTEFYGDYYRKPWWWFRFRYDTQVKRKTILWLLRKSGYWRRNLRVLEVGFGSGVVLFSLDRTNEIAGVEVSASAVAQATLRAKKLGFNKADFRLSYDSDLPFGDCTFDVVIASHVLEHVVDDSRLLSEIHRVLDTRGLSIILVPINERYADAKHVRSYDEATLVSQMTRAGFVTDRVMGNEMLFYTVEKFYFEGYKERWGIAGVMIALVFNVPTSLMPFWMLRVFDKVLSWFGFRPRQCAIAASKVPYQRGPDSSKEQN